MQVKKEELDSIAFGANVLKIEDIDENIDFQNFEKEYVNQYSPIYVYTKIPIEELHKINYLEQHGFEFVECQFELFRRFSKPYDVEAYDSDMEVSIVDNEKDLEEVKLISDKVFSKIDRINLDKNIPADVGKKRYRLYLDNSYKQPNQIIYKSVDKSTNKIMGFGSILFKDDKSAVQLIGGTLPEYQGTNISNIGSCIIYNNFIKQGRKNVTTYISCGNINIVNYMLKGFAFKVKKTYVVLRKLYK